MKKTVILLSAVFLAQAGCRSPQPFSQAFSQRDIHRSATLCTAAVDPPENIAVVNGIEEFVALGLARSPAIAEARHMVDAMRHRLPQVLSLPDPMVNTVTHLDPVETAAGQQAFGLGVSQKFTNSERRLTSAAIVNEELAAAEANVSAMELEIAEGIRTACWQLLVIRRSIEITNDDRESLEQIAEVILRQYEVKRSVTQQDVLNIQIEQSSIENELTTLRQKEKSYQARLARLIHFDPQSDLQILDVLGSGGGHFDVDSLIAQAIQTRPDLRAQLANIRRDRRKIHLACLENKPDFTVGLNWIATSANGISPVANGDDSVQLGIGFNLPIYKDRIRGAVCQAKATRRASESRFESLQDQAAEEVFDLVARLDSTRETLSLIQEDIIPKSERTLELSIDEYATDGIEYVQLIANWRSVLRYRVAEANLQSQYQQLLASLARSVGQLGPIQVDATGSAIPPPQVEQGDSTEEADEVQPEIDPDLEQEQAD